MKTAGRRVQWLLSGDAGSKAYDAASGNDQVLAVAPLAAGAVNGAGALLSPPGSTHMIRCAVANAAGDDVGGHALHIGGAIVINDR
jgi:hypothetical protein